MGKLRYLSREWRARHSAEELRQPGASGGEWIDHSHQAVFARRSYSDGTTSLIATAPSGDALVFRGLVECLRPPYMLLYLLHTPRGEAEPGRYLSEPLEKASALDLIDRFANFLGGDGRHDFWLRSNADNATVVWDRHNLVHAYGPLDRYAAVLNAFGFAPGEPEIPSPHMHVYQAKFDADSRALLQAAQWHHSPLQPEDDD